MSFSTNVKNELCRIELSKCCIKYFLMGVLRGSLAYKNGNTQAFLIITENAAFSRLVYTIIKKIYNHNISISTKKSNRLKGHLFYILDFSIVILETDILKDNNIVLEKEKGLSYLPIDINDRCCQRAYLRGAFLSGGSITDPDKTYHLEITNDNLFIAEEINNLMIQFDLKAKTLKRKESYVTYLKEGQDISDFLNIVNAHSSLMNLENVRIIKDMRNQVNRIVNCETANLSKTVNAAVRQIENIKFIIKTIGLDNIPEGLKEIAQLRIEYSEASLAELGKMLEPSLSKSGVNHKLRKLNEMAENLRNNIK